MHQSSNRPYSDDDCNELLAFRYQQLVHSKSDILAFMDLGQIRALGQIAASLSTSDYALCYPFSFGDLYLDQYPELERLYNGLEFSEQCRVLDVSLEYVKPGTCKALVALNFENGCNVLLSLAKDEITLKKRAIAYLENPLLKTLVDEEQEPQMAKFLACAKKQLLSGEQQTPECSLFFVSCSDEFFVSYVFHQLLGIKYSLSWTKENNPFHLSEETSW